MGRLLLPLAVQKGKSCCPKPSCESEELDQSQINRHGRSFVCCGQGAWSQREDRESISAKTGEGKMQELRFWDRQDMRDVWVETLYFRNKDSLSEKMLSSSLFGYALSVYSTPRKCSVEDSEGVVS